MKKKNYYQSYPEIVLISYKLNRSVTPRKVLCLIFILLTFSACKKLVDVDGPKTSVNSSNIYETDVTAASVLAGIYAKMSEANITNGSELTSMSYLAGLSSDELTLINTDIKATPYYTNALSSQEGDNGGVEFWKANYTNLYIINAVIEGVSSSNLLTMKVKQQLLGEAKFMRAFYFFYLVNLYGDVPIVLSTNYKVNAQISRSPKELVWSQIVIDLKDAKNLLSENYLDATLLASTDERVRPTKWSAMALLARTYLYTKEWKNAEEEASRIINSNSFSIVSLTHVFEKNNKEAIWQLQPVLNGANTQDANAFLMLPQVGGSSSNPVYISQTLLNAFEKGDLRRINWIKNLTINGDVFSFAYKYKIVSSQDPNAPIFEYSTVFRLAEQYLIRAEARVQQDKIDEGISDLNVLRSRATDKDAQLEQQLKVLPNDLSKEDALSAVEHERQVELFTEWGHRWLDLKRTGRVDQVMYKELPKKLPGGIWKSFQQWNPLPRYDLLSNPNLVQNTGY